MCLRLHRWYPSASTCVFPLMERKKRKMENVCGQMISVCLGSSCLISLLAVESLTWTLDVFPLSSILV